MTLSHHTLSAIAWISHPRIPFARSASVVELFLCSGQVRRGAPPNKPRAEREQERRYVPGARTNDSTDI